MERKEIARTRVSPGSYSVTYIEKRERESFRRLPSCIRRVRRRENKTRYRVISSSLRRSPRRSRFSPVSISLTNRSKTGIDGECFRGFRGDDPSLRERGSEDSISDPLRKRRYIDLITRKEFLFRGIGKYERKPEVIGRWNSLPIEEK